MDAAFERTWTMSHSRVDIGMYLQRVCVLFVYITFSERLTNLETKSGQVSAARLFDPGQPPVPSAESLQAQNGQRQFDHSPA